MTLTPEHAAIRIGRITASRAAPVLGKGRWKTQLQAWHDIRGDDEAESDDPALERGIELEPTILAWCGRKLGAVVEPAAPRIHPEHDWLAATPDGIVQVDGSTHLVEAKSVSGAALAHLDGLGDGYGEPGTDQVPIDTYLQAHVQLACHPEASRVAVPVLVGGFAFEFRLYWIDRDPTGEGELLERLGAWHKRHIVDGVRPDATADDEELIKRLFPTAARGAITDEAALVEVAKWAKEYAETHARLKAIETQKKLASTKIRELLEDHDAAAGEGFSVSYRNVKDRTITDYKAIAEQLGASEVLIQHHTRVVPGHRMLRVTIPKAPKGKTK